MWEDHIIRELNLVPPVEPRLSAVGIHQSRRQM
jgi:hypothetical protein